MKQTAEKDACVELEEETGRDWENIQTTKSYGVGIDTHRDFIQVCVLVKYDQDVRKFEKTIYTSWYELNEAKDWIFSIIAKESKPVPSDILPLHYSIESTGTYHLPIIKAIGGNPSIVNPLLASPSRRKTDVLDAKLLAYQNMTGLWPESFIVSDEIQELRLMFAQRQYHKHEQLRISNQINNYILRFGHTVGRLGSVTKSKVVRPIVEDMINGNLDLENYCPTGIPEDVKELFNDLYKQYDEHKQQETKYMTMATEKSKNMKWETSDGVFVQGNELIKNLCTVPGIGETTAVVWLSNIITPKRFPNSKAISAYCGLDPSLKVSAGKVTSTVKRGGNKSLHYSLSLAGSIVLRSRSNNFGVWGYNLYKSTGKWKKAVNAVARKICVGLYYVNLQNIPFSFEKYRCYEKRTVMNIDIDSLISIMPEMKRFKNKLFENQIFNTEDLSTLYYEGRLKDIRGLGKSFFSLVKDFIFNQKKYQSLFENK